MNTETPQPTPSLLAILPAPFLVRTDLPKLREMAEGMKSAGVDEGYNEFWDALIDAEWNEKLNQMTETGELIVYQLPDGSYSFFLGEWDADTRMLELADAATHGGVLTLPELANQIHETMYPEPDYGDSEY